MKYKLIFLTLGLALLLAPAAWGANKEMVALQTQIQALQDQLARLQQANDERFGAMRSLLEQNTDTINRVADSLDELKARLAKVSKQLDDISAAQQNLQAAPQGQPGQQMPQQPPQAQAPP